MIIAGWGEGAGRINYAQSASNTRVVGAESRAITNVLKVPVLSWQKQLKLKIRFADLFVR